MWPLFVLVWKNWILRIRHFYVSICDLLNILFIIYITFNANNSPRTSTKTYDDETVSYHDLQRQPMPGSVLYAPRTILTDQLMNEVGAKLHLSRLYRLPHNNRSGLYGFSEENSMSILKYLKAMSSEDAFVIFENLESKTWPNELRYTIRMKTDSLKSTAGYLRRESPFDLDVLDNFATRPEPCLPLQWAIDTSYRRMRTGDNVEPILMLQELSSATKKFNVSAILIGMAAAVVMPLVAALNFYYFIRRIMDEKTNGMHALVKMMGVSQGVVAVSYVLDMVPILLFNAIVNALYFKLTDQLPNTNPIFIIMATVLHLLTVITLGLIVVYVFDTKEVLPLMPMVLYMALWLVSLKFQVLDNRGVSLLTELFIHTPYARFWTSLALREFTGDSITISNMWQNAKVPGVKVMETSVGENFIFMLLQTIIYFLVAWYLASVRPGKYGQALPCYFPFMKKYWRRQPVANAGQGAVFVNEEDQEYFEKAPSYLPVAIQVINVSKKFGKDQALQEVNLTIYHGEITVLVGHNGAGKTTLVNIITGIISATSGQVLVEGKDTLMQASQVRKLIGVCPQQDFFFPHLTVLEHIRFFAMLRGQKYVQSAITTMARLGLSNQADVTVDVLSGGMRRRLQLACAIVGRPRVLILDEPTRGLDVEARQDIWNLLLSLRFDSTILLTTHLMEEADTLADRIVALQHGHVRCHGTSMFLKRAIGTDYRLTLTTIGAPREAEITAIITGAIPDATVRDRRPNGVSYNLPATDSAKFPALFTAVEAARSDLNIETIGVGKSTLGEVFVKLCSDEQITFTDKMTTTLTIEQNHTEVTGPKLRLRQFAELLLRQCRYMFSRKYSILFMALYSPSVPNCAPVALNALSNALGRRDAQDHPLRAFAVFTHLHPVQLALGPYNDDSIKKSKTPANTDLWTSQFRMVLFFYLCTFSLLPLQDRLLGTRHAHVMAGAPRTLHWCTTLLAHLLRAGLICVPMVIIFAVIENDSTINQVHFLLVFCMLLLLGVLAFLALVYLLSVLFSPAVTSFLLLTSTFIFTNYIPETGVLAVLLPPQYVFAVGLSEAAEVAQVNGYCNLNRKHCPFLEGTGKFETNKCCESTSGSEPWSYWSTSAAGTHLIILAVQFIVFFVLTVIVDDGMISRICKRKYVTPLSRFNDEASREEAAYVESVITLRKNLISDSVLANHVKKIYTKYCGLNTFLAVKDISFSIKKGECFGLLGVNGSGKSTTFKMLTGVTSPTEGVIFANEHFWGERSAYMNSLSYCPQFHGVDGFLTGHQNLALMIRLRGLQTSDVNNVALSCLKELGLTRHANKRASSYSGGMARRLATAVAVCQPARTAVLDDPTAGVDPVARQRTHLAVLRAKGTCTVIIASQSMEMVEALCQRVAIMSCGEIQTLRPTAELKARQEQRYSVVFHLNAQEVTRGTPIFDEFKAKMVKLFKCDLFHQSQFLLSCAVKDSLPVSQLFAQLEQLHEQFSMLVEDYEITEITLEEVFLALAREARTPESDEVYS